MFLDIPSSLCNKKSIKCVAKLSIMYKKVVFVSIFLQIVILCSILYKYLADEKENKPVFFGYTDRILI